MKQKEMPMLREPNTDSKGLPFDQTTIEAVWRMGVLEPGYAYFRKDSCNATMQKNRFGKAEHWGWEIDHIKPVVEGGDDDLSNLQPLQWENNRHKGDKYPKWECKVRL